MTASRVQFVPRPIKYQEVVLEFEDHIFGTLEASPDVGLSKIMIINLTTLNY